MFCLVCALVLLVGCSKKQPLGGKVVYSDNEPVTKGVVVFQTPTFVAQGKIQNDGTYVVGTDKMTDGIPKGEYEITVLGTEDVAYKPGRDNAPMPVLTPTIDAKYTDPKTSGLKFIADGKTRKFNIQVDRAPKTNKKR